MTHTERIICIDWGTTNARAYLVDRDGQVLETRHSLKGIKFVAKDEYPRVFAELTAGWRDSARLCLLSGMVGSANGWEEAPYVPLPATPASIAEGIHRMHAVPDAYIVGGLSYRSPDGQHDVIRGEEVQILGLSVARPQDEYLVCLPGTHSKWLELKHNRIERFTTVMSGDIFAAVMERTIIALMVDEEQDFAPEAFLRGVELAQGPEGVMAQIFKTRTALLFGGLSKRHIRAMVSGIIIGAEIASMRALYPSRLPVSLIGADTLARHYALALEHLGLRCEITDGADLTVKGLFLLARQLETVR